MTKSDFLSNLSKKHIMAKLTWIESFSTTEKYSCELTDEQVKLYNEDPDKFFDEVDIYAFKELEWNEVGSEEESDFQIEE